MSLCQAIDDILEFLEEIENQGHSSVTAENQIQTLKFELRHGRMLLKGLSFSSFFREGTETLIKHVQKCLQETMGEGRTGSTLLEETLSSLLQSKELHHWKNDCGYRCRSYYDEDVYQPGKFVYKDMLIGELALEWIDPLQQNLTHLMRWNEINNLLVFRTEQIEALIKKLRSLRKFLEIIGTGVEEEVIHSVISRKGLLVNTSEDLLTRIKMIIENAIYLSYDSWERREPERMKKLLFDLVAKMNHIELEIRMAYVQLLKASKIENPCTLGIDLQTFVSMDSLLHNLQNLPKNQDTGSGMPLGIHKIEFLHQELTFQRYFLLDPHLKQYTETEQESFYSLLKQVEAMAREGASLTQSICDGENQDDIAGEMNLVASNLIEVLKLLKAKIRQMYLGVPRPSKSDFPQTPTLGFLNFFIQNLEELLRHRPDSIAYVKNEIETVRSELALLSSFFKDALKNSEKEDENFAGRIMDVAYEAERVIDLISASHFPNWYYMLWLSDVIEKIKLLKEESLVVCSKNTSNTSVPNMEKASIHNSPQAYTLAAEEEVVGFEDEAKRIMDRLLWGPKQLDIVAIVGMPGMGKTTLAEKVYKDRSVTLHFHVCSWYCISQVYELRELLLSIIGNVTELTEKILEMNVEDLAEVLYRSLRGKRYLIVIDDIWSIKPWNEIRKSFPDDCNGSRILFTTRIKEVALQANPRTEDPYDIRLLSDGECWEILQKKVFKKRSCPPELYEIGKEIANRCKGLPLSVAIIAGFLVRQEQKEDHWEKVLEDVGQQVVSDSTGCANVLELSYKHLPDHLKPCFLYLGVFPEDHEIPTRKLIHLWIAEGLIPKTKSESLENDAAGYLMDLIARSLVLVAKTRSNGKVKSCRVHDLLHEFSLKKAKDENFLVVSKEMLNPELYRHCFCCKEVSMRGWIPYDPHLRSAFFFPTERASSSYDELYPPDLSVLPYILKLLRVLDLERVTLGYQFPTEIQFLVHLRYLALRGRMDQVPSSIGNVWRLETLIVKGTKAQIKLPETLLEMAYLKRLYVKNWAEFNLPANFHAKKSFESDGIEELSRPSLCYGCLTTEEIIKRLRILRKLKCVFLESWDCFRKCNRFPVLVSLSKLESLNVSYYGPKRLLCEFSFPSSLKKLTLSKFQLPWIEISMIGRLLPQLEVLKLLFRAIEGKRWDVNYGEFRKLKVLRLENLNVVEWDASPDAFSCLEQLVLQKCKQLEKIPSSFGELTTLQKIEVQWCSYSAAKAVCKIQEEQQQLVRDGLRVIIQPADWDSAPTCS